MPTLEGVYVRRTVKPCFSPEEEVKVVVTIRNASQLLTTVEFFETLPPEFQVVGSLPAGARSIAPGGSVDLEYRFSAPASRGPALIQGKLTLDSQGTPRILAVETPVAVYPEHPISHPERLEDVRDRLVAVTNFHKRSGHLLMMDGPRYFRESLNVPLTPFVERMIHQEFAFTDYGLPVPGEEYDAVLYGDKEGILFIDRITLETDEFTECDAAFKTERTREFSPVAKL